MVRVEVVHRGSLVVVELTLVQLRDLERIVDEHRRWGPVAARHGRALVELGLVEADGRFSARRPRYRPTALGLLTLIERENVELGRDVAQLGLGLELERSR